MFVLPHRNPSECISDIWSAVMLVRGDIISMQAEMSFSVPLIDPGAFRAHGIALVPGVLVHNEQNHKCWRGVTGC